MSTEISGTYIGHWGDERRKSRRIYVELGHDELSNIVHWTHKSPTFPQPRAYIDITLLPVFHPCCRNNVLLNRTGQRAHNLFAISELTHKGQPVTVCAEASCVGRCGASSGDGRGWCSCDRQCWIIGDCCLDAPLHCFGATNTDISETHPPSDTELDDTIVMRTLMNEPFTIDKITPSLTNVYKVQTIPLLTVAECMFVDHSSGCAQSYEVSAKHHLPVCHPKLDLIFRNTFCAGCNGFESHEVVSFENWLEMCPEWLQFNYTMDELFHNKALVDLFYSTCYKMNMLIPEACRSSVSRNHRYHTWPNTDNSTCLHFANPMYIKDLNVKSIFKNQFCTNETDWLNCVSSSNNFDEFKTTINKPLAVKVDSDGVLTISKVDTNEERQFSSPDVEKNCGKQPYILSSIKMIPLLLSSVIVDSY